MARSRNKQAIAYAIFSGDPLGGSITCRKRDSWPSALNRWANQVVAAEDAEFPSCIGSSMVENQIPWVAFKIAQNLLTCDSSFHRLSQLQTASSACCMSDCYGQSTCCTSEASTPQHNEGIIALKVLELTQQDQSTMRVNNSEQDPRT